MIRSYDKDSKAEPKFSDEEREIINDIRRLKFGRVVVFIQNGFIISKEVTKTIKIKDRFNNKA